MVKEKLKNIVLLTLEAAVDYGVDLADYYSNPRRFLYWQPKWEKSDLSLAIHRLGKKGLVEKTVDEGRVILRLTQAGRLWMLTHRKDEDLKEWDGLWRLVIFDIPETRKKIRETLRNKLKEWGFVKWQKSVWVSKKPLTEELRALVADLGLSDWVLIVESGNIGR